MDNICIKIGHVSYSQHAEGTTQALLPVNYLVVIY